VPAPPRGANPQPKPRACSADPGRPAINGWVLITKGLAQLADASLRPNRRAFPWAERFGANKDSADKARRFRQRPDHLTGAQYRLCDGQCVHPKPREAARFAGGEALAALLGRSVMHSRAPGSPSRSHLPENRARSDGCGKSGHRLSRTGAPRSCRSSPQTPPSPRTGCAAHIIWSAGPIRSALFIRPHRVRGPSCTASAAQKIPLIGVGGSAASIKPLQNPGQGASRCNFYTALVS